MNAGSGFGFGGLDVVTIGQVVQEDLSTTKAKVPNSKHAHNIKTIASTPTPYISPLNTPPSIESRITFPSREEPQGPSPEDNDLELDVDFLLDMVSAMQEGVARKARRMVIR
jgi:hypothetical protein